jgi:hypothetical protein
LFWVGLGVGMEIFGMYRMGWAGIQLDLILEG